MANKHTKKLVASFCHEFGLTEINTVSLKDAISKQGYTIVEFNNIYNDENVEALIESLNLSQIARHSRGFTYADNNYRLVFLHEDLSEDEKLLVLAHEAGHIYCKHMTSSPIIGKDVSDEYEANEFAHFLLNQTPIEKALYQLKKHKWIVIAVCTAIVVLVAALGIGQAIIKSNQPFGEYYITVSGSKYHEKDCIYVKNKSDARLITKDEYESGDYQACKTCLPDK